jgi:sensor histidine kinase YesM
MLLERNVMGSEGYIDHHTARSDIRIKLEGNPTTHDLETVKYIVDEINSLKLNIKAKIVHSFPSLVVQVGTEDPLLEASRITNQGERDFMKRIISEDNYASMIAGRDTLTREMWNEGSSQFFPKLSFATIFLNTELTDQNTRDIFLWTQITKTLTDIYPPIESRFSVTSATNRVPGFSGQERKVLKSIFSPDFNDRIKLFGGSASPINNKVLIIVFISLILFFILYEISNYFSFNRFINNSLLRISIYALFIAQLFVLTSSLINKDFLNHLLKWEIYICGFILVACWLFVASDKLLIKYFKKSWLRLLVNPFLTLIALYLAYQVVYLFVRAELLRLLTIDINAKFIALSVIAVRFYLQYENEKITSLIQEKDYEVTRQKELKNRAELNTLQAKINPHFLYNALNSIAALAHIDSKRTEEMALSLSKLFRYNVNREEDMVSTIRQEIEMVQLYLQIEKQRFADRLSFDILVDENLNEHQVPRFLIQPLVENAIKHGISKITGQGVIKLKIFERGKNLFIEIYDNGPEFPQGLITGYGLQNTYDKLTLLYKKPYEIRFVNEPEKYIQIKL